MRVCPECKKVNSYGDTNCTRCNTSLDLTKVAATYVKICPRCKDETYPPADETCPKCHATLAAYSLDPQELPPKPDHRMLEITIFSTTSVAIYMFSKSVLTSLLLGAIGATISLVLKSAFKQKPPRISHIYAAEEESFQWTCAQCGMMNEGSGGDCDFCGRSKKSEF